MCRGPIDQRTKSRQDHTSNSGPFWRESNQGLEMRFEAKHTWWLSCETSSKQALLMARSISWQIPLPAVVIIIIIIIIFVFFFFFFFLFFSSLETRFYRLRWACLGKYAMTLCQSRISSVHLLHLHHTLTDILSGVVVPERQQTVPNESSSRRAERPAKKPVIAGIGNHCPSAHTYMPCLSWLLSISRCLHMSIEDATSPLTHKTLLRYLVPMSFSKVLSSGVPFQIRY
ncbi:hypothetical protein V8C37DRAFT_230740 [Trichoderma ceciliae]